MSFGVFKCLEVGERRIFSKGDYEGVVIRDGGGKLRECDVMEFKERRYFREEGVISCSKCY